MLESSSVRVRQFSKNTCELDLDIVLSRRVNILATNTEARLANDALNDWAQFSEQFG